MSQRKIVLEEHQNLRNTIEAVLRGEYVYDVENAMLGRKDNETSDLRSCFSKMGAKETRSKLN